jgi:K+-sensing histidine kinase KdpD
VWDYISHDIRAPLTVVQGGIRAMMLGIEIESGSKYKHLETIYEKVLYMNKFIDELFLLSRFEQAAAIEETELAGDRGLAGKGVSRAGARYPSTGKPSV